MNEKKRFLTVDDYGMGGIWIYVFARNEKEIRVKYPKLSVVHQRPDWLIAAEASGKSLMNVDVDDEIPENLRYLSH